MKPTLILLTALILMGWRLNPRSTNNLGDYQIIIEGTSNVHDWTEKVTAMTGNCQIVPNTDGTISINSLDLKIDVKSIRSEHGSMMDGKTYKAMKAEDFPYISFKLLAPLKNIKVSSSGTMINAKGQVTIAGVSKSIDLQVKATAKGSDKILFEGNKALKMSDYGISAPTAFAGAMKVGDEVTIIYKSTFLINNSIP